MRADLDRLMQARDLDALLVVSEENYNAIRDYLTLGARLTGGYVLKKRGEPAVLVVNAMEVDEAAASGLRVVSWSELDYYSAYAEYRDDPLGFKAWWWQALLGVIGIEAGRVGVYGAGDLNVYIELFRLLDQRLPGITLVGETGMTLFAEAMRTKDTAEVARIRVVAERTHAVVAQTWDYIAGHAALDDAVVDAAGKPLTIGDVKRFVRRALLDQNLEDTGMIFAQGRDAGFPHSRGRDDMPLRLGQTLVFDLFPREIGGGYHHDMTRTWCIGYAPAEVAAAYAHVMTAFDIGLEAVKAGAPGALAQNAVCDYFEAQGYPTLRTSPKTTEGYTHSLGHGVGLLIHERPSLSHLQADVLEAGNVVSVEPGLYYRDQGFGIRIEDLVYLDDSGAVVPLTTFHKGLVLPLRG